MKTIVSLLLCMFVVLGVSAQKSTTKAATTKTAGAKISVVNSDTVKTVEANFTLMQRLSMYQKQSANAKANYESAVKSLEKRWIDDVEIAIQQQLGKKGKPVKVKRATVNKDSTITVILQQ